MTIVKRLAAALGVVLFAAPGMADSTFDPLTKPISVIVSLKAKVSMRELADNVQNPNSAHFGRYYTPEEIADLAGPSVETYTKTVSQLKSKGLKVRYESKTRLWVTFTGDPETVKRIFQTTTSASAASQVTHSQLYTDQISLLTSSALFRPKFRMRGLADQKKGGTKPEVLKQAYGFDPIYAAGFTGKGQHIAIATYGGFKMSDVKSYFQKVGSTDSRTIDQVSFNGEPPYDEGSATETQLDIAMAGLIAPGANIHVYGSAENGGASEPEMFTAILDDDQSKIINYSWGHCERYQNPGMAKLTSEVFARAVAQGVNIFVASGDDGSSSCKDGTQTADWPSVSDNIVSVGGTSFRFNRTNHLEEIGWNGSGGGISNLIDRPFWQASLAPQYKRRSYPDVALTADPRYATGFYATLDDKLTWLVAGGTSMASPLWAGFLALVGEARKSAGKNPIGYINPIIYAMSGEARALSFNDVRMGRNGAFSAGVGWDAVTGWGSLKASGLLDYFNH